MQEKAPSAAGELGRLEDLAVAGDRGLHQRRVEGAGDRQADRLGPFGAQRLARLADLLGVAGEDHLAGRVVVGEGEAEARGDGADDLVGAAERGDHAAGADRRGLLHQAAADDREAQPGVGLERPRGDQRRQLAERVPGVEAGGRLTGRLPVGEPGDEEGGLGEVGALADLLEGVDAEFLARLLDQVRALLGADRGHGPRLAPLAGEEQGGIYARIRHS